MEYFYCIKYLFLSKFYGMGCFMGINMILLYLVGLLCVNVVYNLEYKL